MLTRRCTMELRHLWALLILCGSSLSVRLLLLPVVEGLEEFWLTNRSSSSPPTRFQHFEPRLRHNLAAMAKNLFTDREGRGFQFHADNSGVTVDMEFIIPFGKIPVARSMSVATTTLRSLLNLNKVAILWTSVFIAIGGLLFGAVKLLHTPFFHPPLRQTRNELSQFDSFRLDAPRPEIGLDDNESAEQHEWMQSLWGLNWSSCAQQLICDYMRRNSALVRSGGASPVRKFLDSLLSLELSGLRDTLVMDALSTARSTRPCHQVYHHCHARLPPN